MTGAIPGNRVKIHYTGTLNNGDVFDSTRHHEPLEFVIGGGQVFKGIEAGVIGMEVGESKEIRIEATEAFGDRRKEKIFSMERNKLPKSLDLKIGLNLKFKRSDGSSIPVKIKRITNKNVTFDANHPLAGKDLNFKIELLEVA
jgi:peptidylprolyl isomerase